VYETPGRAATGIPEQYIEQREDFFLRFPLACSVEFIPPDVLYPAPGQQPAWPRDRLFARRHWVFDACWEKLFRLGTHPLGSKSASYNKFGSRVLLCYNLPEDLPVLAQRRGERFWRYFGPEWQYVRDRQMNDWMTIEAQGTVFVGNMGTNPASVSLEMPVAAAPGDGQLVVSSRNSGGVAFNLPALRIVTLSLTNILVNPGTNAVSFRFRGTAPDQSTRLLVQGVTVKESTVPSDR
jgi:hypothetical protein